jgi:hypothetical protein
MAYRAVSLEDTGRDRVGRSDYPKWGRRRHTGARKYNDKCAGYHTCYYPWSLAF